MHIGQSSITVHHDSSFASPLALKVILNTTDCQCVHMWCKITRNLILCVRLLEPLGVAALVRRSLLHVTGAFYLFPISARPSRRHLDRSPPIYIQLSSFLFNPEPHTPVVHNVPACLATFLFRYATVTRRQLTIIFYTIFVQPLGHGHLILFALWAPHLHCILGSRPRAPMTWSVLGHYMTSHTGMSSLSHYWATGHSVHRLRSE